MVLRMCSRTHKIDKVNALLRDRHAEFIKSIEAETEQVRNSNFHPTPNSSRAPERPLVIFTYIHDLDLFDAHIYFVTHFQTKPTGRVQPTGAICYDFFNHGHLPDGAICHFCLLRDVHVVRRSK